VLLGVFCINVIIRCRALRLSMTSRKAGHVCGILVVPCWIQVDHMHGPALSVSINNATSCVYIRRTTIMGHLLLVFPLQ